MRSHLEDLEILGVLEVLGVLAVLGVFGFLGVLGALGALGALEEMGLHHRYIMQEDTDFLLPLHVKVANWLSLEQLGKIAFGIFRGTRLLRCRAGDGTNAGALSLA